MMFLKISKILNVSHVDLFFILTVVTSRSSAKDKSYKTLPSDIFSHETQYAGWEITSHRIVFTSLRKFIYSS